MGDHEDYLPGETPSPHKTTHQVGGADQISVAGLAGETAALAAHKILPTVHQNAPGLIETHRLAAGAHHAKYTDAEARAVHSPISIHPAAFVPRFDTYDWSLSEYRLTNRSALTLQYFYAPIVLPHGCTVTKLTLYGSRVDAASTFILYLFRTDRITTRVVMSIITATWTDGYNSLYDDTIASPIIDNNNYQYSFRLALDPNDSIADCQFTGAKIEFTG